MGGRRARGSWAVALLVAATGCTYSVSDPPSVRYLPLEDARRYVDGQHHYRIDLELRKGGSAPAAVATETTSLTLELTEHVSTSDGALTRVSLVVDRATAVGHDADGEREAARGRYLVIAPRETLWEIEFGGGALGTEGQVRAADLALLAHLMAPTEPKQRPDVGGAIPEYAVIDTGWSSRRLDLRGSSVLSAFDRVEGRAVSRYVGTLAGQAPVSVEIGTGPAPSLVYTEPPLGCLFFLLDFCSVPSPYWSAVYQPTVDMTGPMAITQEGLVHRDSGRLLRLDGRGSARIGGTMPPVDPRLGGSLSDELLLISASPVALDLEWTFSVRLTDPWPKDPLPTAVVVGAALCLAAVALSHLVALMATVGVWPFPGRRQ